MAVKYKMAGYQDGGILKMAGKQKRGQVKMAKNHKCWGKNGLKTLKIQNQRDKVNMSKIKTTANSK
jgi:hypothetical protein